MKRFSRLRYVLLGLATGVLLCVGAYLSVAGTTAKRGSDISRVKVVHGLSARTTSNPFVPISGATETITVRPGEPAFLIAHFTAETSCVGEIGICALEITVDGERAQPSMNDVIYESAFDSAEPNDKKESHATHRSIGPLPAGSYKVQVEIAVSDPDNGTVFDLDMWSLIIERVEV